MAKRKVTKPEVGLQAVEDWLASQEFFGLLKWIDGTPLLDHIEPYRLRQFKAFLDPIPDATGRLRLRYNLHLNGKAKKNWKSTDLILAAFFALLANDSVGGNEILLIASDEGQAAEDLDLAKKLVEGNPVLAERLLVREKMIGRRDGRGRMRILPGRDVAGEHGKSYRFLGYDEIHTVKTHDQLEALALDPTRVDAQMWITSYASLYHKPGARLYDLIQIGKAGTDPRMFFTWYAADFTTDPDFQTVPPEQRANPSMASWNDPDYLTQQQRRLPGHKFRRLHLNLGGLPEGAAYTVEMVLDAIERGTTKRAPQPGTEYVAFVDMSGGSRDDACLAIAHLDARGRTILDRLVNQGPPPPFDPRQAVRRFADLMDEYGITHVWGDRLGGQTFIFDFAQYNKVLNVSQATTSQIYEALEPRLNAREIVLLDAPTLEQQLLGLIWRGQKIDHPNGEHDDWSCAAAGALLLACEPAEDYTPTPAEQRTLDGFRRWTDAPISEEVIDTESVDPYQHESMVWHRDGRPLW